MARAIHKLTAQACKTAPPGKHGDGGGLWLIVEPGGSRRWAFIFRWNGRTPEMGLGSFQDVPLAKARELAAAARQTKASGVNPIDARREERARAAAGTTFGAVAEELIASLGPAFRNEKHRNQWRSTLKTYAARVWARPVEAIGVEDVLAILQPIWLEKPETASRVRGRIERVLDAARARGLRTGENPARWRGHLDHLLARRAKATKRHHSAMPYDEVPAFVAKLRERPALAALALEFAILTAARSGEALGARWAEIDRKAGLWIVPAERMKGGREHRVPLCRRALDILNKATDLAERDDEGFVFPGQRRGKPLSNMAFAMLLRRMGHDDVTAHGFRSAFRDWCGDATHFPREVAEAALAHQIGNTVEAAYRRSDALEKRRALMLAWETYIEQQSAENIVELRPRVAVEA